MNYQPYFFQIIPRNIIAKNFGNQTGQFKCYVYKESQVMGSSKPFEATFNNQSKMKVQNSKLGFCLPNYIAKKNANAKYIFKLSKKSQNGGQKLVGQFIIDANIYVEQLKKSQKNHFSQIWGLQQSYLVQVQIYVQQSRYLLQKTLKQNSGNIATYFNKPLASPQQSLAQSKRSQIEDKQFDNEDRYKQKRIALLNQYSKAIVGSGGYKIVMQEQQNKKKLQKQKINKKLRKQEQIELKKSQTKKNDDNRNQVNNKSNKKQQQRQEIKTSTKKLKDDQSQETSQSELKSLKYAIILLVILLICSAGYFASKVFIKQDIQQKLMSQQIQQEQEQQTESKVSKKSKPAQSQKKQKKSNKKTKKSKSSSQL